MNPQGRQKEGKHQIDDMRKKAKEERSKQTRAKGPRKQTMIEPKPIFGQM